MENAPEKIDYKSELEKANSRIAELEMNNDILTLKEQYHFSEKNGSEIVLKLRALVSGGFASDLFEAADMLSAKSQDTISKKLNIEMGSTKGVPLGGDSFTSAFKGNIPSFSPSTANANIVKDRSGFFERGNTIKIGEIKPE